jgi:hypothetical protein
MCGRVSKSTLEVLTRPVPDLEEPYEQRGPPRSRRPSRRPLTTQWRLAGGLVLARILAGGYVEALSFVVLLPVLVFLARVYGRRSEASRWAAQTSLLAGLGYAVVTLASGMPPEQRRCTASSTVPRWRPPWW